MNTVVFYTDQPTLEKIDLFFSEMAAKEKAEHTGQLPAFVKAQSGWMHQICFEGDVLYFITKWSPNPEIIISIADHFSCDFVQTYDETSNLIYGEIAYRNKVVNCVFLEPADFDLYECQEGDTYIFEGTVYESEADILEELLDRKR